MDDSLRAWNGDKRIKAILTKCNFTTANEVLACPDNALQSRTRLSIIDVRQCKAAISEWRFPTSLSVHGFLQAELLPVLSTGFHELDNLLGGGLRCGILHEVFGEASAAKTNFCLQLCLQTQLPAQDGGLGGTTLYLSAEGAFPILRLRQMASARKMQIDAAENVVLAQIIDFEALEHALLYTVAEQADRLVQTRFPLKLIILDSLAAPLRSEDTSGSASIAQRAKSLTSIGHRMKSFAAERGIILLVVNQVADIWSHPLPLPSLDEHQKFDDSSSNYSCSLRLPSQSQSAYYAQSMPRSKQQVTLGLSWANLVDVRIALSRSKKRKASSLSEAGLLEAPLTESLSVRKCTLVFSPFACPGTIDFVVTESGLGNPWAADWRTPSSLIQERNASPISMELAVDEAALWKEYEEIDPDQLVLFETSFEDACVAQKLDANS